MSSTESSSNKDEKDEEGDGEEIGDTAAKKPDDVVSVVTITSGISGLSARRRRAIEVISISSDSSPVRQQRRVDVISILSGVSGGGDETPGEAAPCPSIGLPGLSESCKVGKQVCWHPGPLFLVSIDLCFVSFFFVSRSLSTFVSYLFLCLLHLLQIGG